MKPGIQKPHSPRDRLTSGLVLGKPKQGLTTPDKVAGTKAKKTNGDRHEGRTCKRECLRFHFMSPFFEVCALIFLSITAALDDYYESFSTARK